MAPPWLMIREKGGCEQDETPKWNHVWINLSIIHFPSLVCVRAAARVGRAPGNILYMFTSRRYTGRGGRDDWTTKEFFLLQLVGMSLLLELSLECYSVRLELVLSHSHQPFCTVLGHLHYLVLLHR